MSHIVKDRIAVMVCQLLRLSIWQWESIPLTYPALLHEKRKVLSMPGIPIQYWEFYIITLWVRSLGNKSSMLALLSYVGYITLDKIKHAPINHRPLGTVQHARGSKGLPFSTW